MEPDRPGFPGVLSLTVELAVRIVAGSSESCPHCQQHMDLHQPDEGLPGQLLATCEACQRWFCLYESDDAPSPGHFLMVEVPERSAIERARQAAGLELP